jgi:hypothetical protein
MVLDIMDLPALAPPEGVVSNFDNPDNLSQPELAVLQLIVATLAVIVRIFTKHFIVRKMLVEDCKLASLGPICRLRTDVHIRLAAGGLGLLHRVPSHSFQAGGPSHGCAPVGS